MNRRTRISIQSDYLPVMDAARRARVTPRTLWRWIDMGELTAEVAGTVVLVRKDELANIIERRGDGRLPKRKRVKS